MTPVRILLALCATAGFLVFSPAVASEILSHDIPAQPLAQALSEFADQTGLQLFYVSGIAATRVSQRAPRGLPAEAALRVLLADTGLHFEFLNDRTVRIFADPDDGGPRFGVATLAAQSSSGSRSPVAALEDVTVTSTRWWFEPPTQAVAPVTILTRRDIERGGQNSIGNVLQALPMTTGSPLNTNVNFSGTAEPRARGEAGDGSVRIYLHDLPTVVLLNGRRLPNSGLGADASVDLNALPIAFIERVDVLASGASAVFGADAVGGVVNIVTQRAKPGLELSGKRTITERGDGEIVTGQATAGFELLGGTWNLGIDYVEQDGVTMDRRRYSASPLIIVDGDGTRSPDGYNNMAPNGYFDVPEGNALGLEPGVYTRVPGASGQSSADYRPYDRGRDGFNPAPFSYSQTPNERATLWLMGSHPLNDRTNFIAEALAHHRQSAQRAAPAFYRTGFASPGDWGHPADNYYNPFGVDVPWINRRLVEIGNRATTQELDLWRAMIGLEGNVARWTWEGVIQGARSEATAVEEGFLSRPRLVSALGPSGLDESGRIVCGPPDPATGHVPAASVVPGCVPLNLFGGAGSITQEQLAYVSSTIFNRGTNEQQLAQFVSGGPAGQFLGRDLHWVLGAEYRREAGRLVPDARRAAFVGDTYFPAQNTGLPELVSAVSGTYDAYELFSSVQLPLLHDRRGSRDMALNIGLRWSDFESFDGHATWQAGLRWQPIQELTLRANYGEVFRAPSLAELHEGPTSIEQYYLTDPCGNDPTPTQRVNCAASGVPGGAYVQDGWGLIATYGGNPDLEPETGHTLGAGLIYTPAWAEGLSASVDYFQAQRSDQISVVSAEELLNQCADQGNLCGALARYPEGHVYAAATLYYNFGKAEVRALDFAINWSAMTRVGELNARLLATYLDRWDRQPIPGGEVYSYAGTFDAGARPHWRASGFVDWRSGPWMASYAAEYIGSYSERVDDWPQFDIYFEPFYRRVEPALYHDLEAGFTFDSGVTVRAAITNVTDEDPPYLNIAPANTDVSTYRLLGRSYFLELRYKAE